MKTEMTTFGKYLTEMGLLVFVSLACGFALGCLAMAYRTARMLASRTEEYKDDSTR